MHLNIPVPASTSPFFIAFTSCLKGIISATLFCLPNTRLSGHAGLATWEPTEWAQGEGVDYVQEFGLDFFLEDLWRGRGQEERNREALFPTRPLILHAHLSCEPLVYFHNSFNSMDLMSLLPPGHMLSFLPENPKVSQKPLTTH